MMIKRSFGIVAGLFAAFLALVPTPAQADPHSSPVQILSVRPYYLGSGNTEYAYITTTSGAVCSGATYFTLALNSPAGEAMISTALTALSSGRSVTVEVSNSTGCTVIANGGPQIQSLTLLASGYSGPF
jgi:hypothetical protein